MPNKEMQKHSACLGKCTKPVTVSRTRRRHYGSFGLAAEHNDAEAEKFFGEMYDKGTGVTVNTPEAIKWYRRASEHRKWGSFFRSW